MSIILPKSMNRSGIYQAAYGGYWHDSDLGSERTIGRELENEAQTKEAAGMITKEDKDTIIRCAKRYNVESVILFGSSTRDDIESNDIDIGVKGIEPRLFFKFYAELFRRLPKPVDLVDLSKKSLFNDLVEETGVRIYG